MNFSIYLILIIPIVLILVLVLWKKYSWKTYIGYLEPAESEISSYRKGEFSRSRFFFHKDGVIDLKKHLELKRFHVFGGKDVLVKPWDKTGDLYVEEGETKIAIFDIIEDQAGISIAIPCLRVLEKIMTDETDDPLTEYRKTSLAVSFEHLGEKEFRTLPSENLIGVVEYESI